MAKVNFRTNVLLKSIIGKDLITDDNIAVLELVKNSFDAGSKESNIIFRNVIHNQEIKDYKKLNSSEIIISDIGSGMSEYDLVNKWLNIAYSEKKAKKEEHNRTLAGNKGVGRFSCDRLGKFLTIYTKKENTELIKLSIDWRKFEQIDDIGINIQDIDFELNKISMVQYQNETNLDVFNSGTTLLISSLREEWSHKKILSLKRQLEKFINPNQSFESEKFDVNIEAKEFLKLEEKFEKFEKINGLIENKIFDKLNFKVTYIHSKISKDGKTITTTLKDRGKEIFILEEHNRFDLLKDIDIHIYYLNPYSKAYFKKQTGMRSVDFGSISLFINGFRIPPYGDAGNDWLGMELRKGQGHSRYLGTREVIGRIEINGIVLQENEDNFFIISNRSGVDNNKHYKQLTKNKTPFGYYFKTFRRLERFVVEGIKWDSSKLKDAEIEKRVLSDDDWDESKEEYKEDSLVRNKRVISIVEKIIDAKANDIISLIINNSFVSDLANEQAKKSEAELNSIIEQLSKKELNSSDLNELLNKILASKTELDTFPVPQTEIDKLKLEQKKLETQVQQQLENLKTLEEEKRKATENAEKLEEELELEKEKNTYLLATRRTLSPDADGLIHTIKINNIEVRDGLDNIIDDLTENDFEIENLIKKLGFLKINAERSLKMAEFVTRADLKEDIEKKDVDIVSYIKEYISLYGETFSDKISFKFETNNSYLNKNISVLNLSIILDNLISNAVKWNAENILLDFENINKKQLALIISDDGDGLATKFLNNSDRIFELSVREIPPTHMSGSGIGLFYTKNLLNDMNCDISFLGNNVKLKGASFKIIFNTI